MTTKPNQSGPMVATESAVEIFRLMSIRSQLRLEAVGMKSSGGALRPRIAAEFGLTARAKHAAFIEKIEAKLNELSDAAIKARND